MRNETFDQNKISQHKRLVRADLYKGLGNALNRHKITGRPSVMILPGRVPRDEIEIVKKIFPTVHLTAVDRDHVAIQAAYKVGVDRVYNGHIESFPSGERFDIIHLDLCGPLGQNTFPAIRKAKTLADKFLAITISYGRDDFETLAKEAAGWQKFYAKKDYIWNQVSPKRFDRLFNLWRFVGTDTWKVLRSYGYRGSGLHYPMLTVVFGRQDEPSWTPLDYEAEDYFGKWTILDLVPTYGLELTARLFGIEKQSLIAMKAIRTRDMQSTLQLTKN